MSVEYVIRCDECDDIMDASSVSAAQARKLIRLYQPKAITGRRDLCELHATDREDGSRDAD